MVLVSVSFPLGAADSVVELEEMIITGQRHSPEDPVDEDSYPAFVTVINVDERAGVSLSVADVLEEQVGVDIREYGGLGSFSSVSIRGASPEQVLVILDGVMLNQASGGAVDLSTIPFSQVSSIEVFRGISPSHLGVSAPGGVIQIRTRSAGEGVEGRLHAGYGSFDTRQASAHVSGKRARSAWAVSGDVKGSEGDYEFLDDNRTEFNPEDDRETKRVNNDFDEWSALAKYDRESVSGWTTRVTANAFSREQGVPGISSNQSRSARLKTDRVIVSAGISNESLAGGRAASRSSVSFHRVSYAFEDKKGPAGEVGLGRQDTENVNDTLTVGTGVSWIPEGPHLLYFGVQWRRDEYDPEDNLAAAQPEGSERDTVGLVLSDEITLGEGRVRMMPAIRKEFYASELKSDVSGDDLSADDASPLSAQCSVRVALSDWATLKAGAGTYYRSPNFYELFGDRGGTMGNADLEAEEGMNRDIGLRATFRGDGEEGMWCEAAYFNNEIDELIQYVFDARGVGRAVNVGSARMRGIELSMGATFPGGLELSQRTTVQDTENTSGLPAQDGKDLPLRPRTKHSLRVEYGSKLKIWYQWNREGKRFQDTANLLEMPAQEYVTCGVSVSRGAFSLSVEVRNLRNRELFDIGGYPLPGRSVFAAVQWEF